MSILGRKRADLRIYLGAAPGVGKTYSMLGEAHRRMERGTDVVAAWIETHGRRRTAQQLAGIEVIPPTLVEHEGTRHPRSTSTRCLARRPQVVLVDDLAHANTPAAATPTAGRTWSDFLNAGITVITTVNVQHLESLNDVVSHITGTAPAAARPRRIRAGAPTRSNWWTSPRKHCGAGLLTATCTRPSRPRRRWRTTSGPAT